MITAASAAALKVSTSAILGQDLVHKTGQRHLGAAFGSTEFSALKMGRIWCTRQVKGAVVGLTIDNLVPDWKRITCARSRCTGHYFARRPRYCG